MKWKFLAVAVLAGGTCFAQTGKHAPAAAKPVANHGTAVSSVAKTTHDGEMISTTASSKSKGNHYAYAKGHDEVKAKPVKVRRTTFKPAPKAASALKIK